VIINGKEYIQSLVLGASNKRDKITIEFVDPKVTPLVYVLAVIGGVIVGGGLIYALASKKLIFSSFRKQ
jgi:hypothetical protein